MTTPAEPTPPSPASRRARRLAITAAVAALVGSLCAFLPVQYEKPCHLAANLLSLLVGGQ